MRRVPALIAALLVLAACGGRSEIGISIAGDGRAPTLFGEVLDHGTIDLSASPEPHVVLELHDYFIRPTFVVVAPNASLTVTFRNAGLVPHRLYVVGAGVDALLHPGQEGTAAIRAPAEGGVEFFDAIYRGQGARGAIVVRPARGRRQ